MQARPVRGASSSHLPVFAACINACLHWRRADMFHRWDHVANEGYRRYIQPLCAVCTMYLAMAVVSKEVFRRELVGSGVPIIGDGAHFRQSACWKNIINITSFPALTPTTWERAWDLLVSQLMYYNLKQASTTARTLRIPRHIQFLCSPPWTLPYGLLWRRLPLSLHTILYHHQPLPSQ